MFCVLFENFGTLIISKCSQLRSSFPTMIFAATIIFRRAAKHKGCIFVVTSLECKDFSQFCLSICPALEGCSSPFSCASVWSGKPKRSGNCGNLPGEGFTASLLEQVGVCLPYPIGSMYEKNILHHLSYKSTKCREIYQSHGSCGYVFFFFGMTGRWFLFGREIEYDFLCFGFAAKYPDFGGIISAA